MSTENYFISYDLNGQRPTHKEMDDHLKKLGPCTLRVLETVWFVRFPGDLDAMFKYANSILSQNDRLLVIEAINSSSRNLLVPFETLQRCWKPNT